MSDTSIATTSPAQAAFTAVAEGGPVVFVVNGNTARPVVTIDASQTGFEAPLALVTTQLSPDGTRLVYTVSDNSLEKPSVKLVSLSDGSTSDLLQGRENESLTNFCWKPDGSELAYVRIAEADQPDQPYISQLWLAPTSGGEPRQFYGDDVLSLLGWSQDGSKIHFTRRIQGFFAYSIKDVASGEIKNVYLPTEVEGGDLHVLGLTLGSSATGERLAYVLNSSPYLQNCNSTIVRLVDANDGSIKHEFTADGGASSLTFSPDLSMLAFTTLIFPPGTSQPSENSDEQANTVKSGVEIFSLRDESKRELVSPRADVGQYRVLAWASENAGLFVTNGDGTVEFVGMDGQTSTVVEAPLEASGGLSVGGSAGAGGFTTGAVVNLDIPYIHQVKMTPDEFDGNWACGPTSATMAAAYYRKLQPRNDSYGGHSSPYGWYISNEFRSDATGHVFNRRDGDASGRLAAGAYGHCVEGGLGYAWRIADYLKKLGIRATFRDSVSLSVVKQYLNEGKPIVLSTNIQGFGHLVLVKGYMPDGRLVINDPYWAKPGAGEIVYTWGALGGTPWMITIEDAPPAPEVVPPPATQNLAPPPVVPIQEVPPPVQEAPTEPGTGNEALAPRFRAAFERNGGEGSLGRPSSKVYSYNGRWLQEFNGGSQGEGVLVVDDRADRPGDQPMPTVQPAFAVFGEFFRAWRDMYGGSGGVLGSPMSDEYNNTQGNRQQSFEAGYVLKEGGNPIQAYPWPEDFNAWKAEYFNNTGLAGRPSHLRDEPPNGNGGITHEWGENAPDNGQLGIMAEAFSARFTRSINFGEGGIYNMVVTADDGFRITIDGQNLAGENPNQYWKFSSADAQTFRVQVGAGVHTIVLEYFEGSGGAMIALDINPE